MLKKLFIWSTLGIILFWIGLILHVTYHHSFTKREKLSEPEWPAHVDFKMEKALIKNRNHVLNDLKEVFSCRLDPKKFLSMYGTLNMTWEDPLGRYELMKEVLMSKPILVNFVFLKTLNSKYTMRYIQNRK
jgi:hypothetical protein